MKQFIILPLFLFALSCASTKGYLGENIEGDGSDIQTRSEVFGLQGSDSGRIDGLSSIHFGFDQVTLSELSKQKLAQNVQWLRNNRGYNVQIEGHCDSRGSVEYNLALGERRAKVVQDYLSNLGIASSRVTVISYGKEKLIDDGTTDSAHAKNRRSNFVPIKK